MRWSRVDEEEVWAELLILFSNYYSVVGGVVFWFEKYVEVRSSEDSWKSALLFSSACLWDSLSMDQKKPIMPPPFLSCHHYLMHSQGRSDYFLLFRNPINRQKREHLSPTRHTSSTPFPYSPLVYPNIGGRRERPIPTFRRGFPFSFSTKIACCSPSLHLPPHRFWVCMVAIGFLGRRLGS